MGSVLRQEEEGVARLPSIASAFSVVSDAFSGHTHTPMDHAHNPQQQPPAHAEPPQYTTLR